MFNTAPNMQLATALLDLCSSPAAAATRIADALCASCLDVRPQDLSASVLLLYNVLDATDVVTELLQYALAQPSGGTHEQGTCTTSAASLLHAVQLQGTLLGSLVPVGLQELQGGDGPKGVVDRLLAAEHYALAVYVSKRCGLDARPAWLQWACALLRCGAVSVGVCVDHACDLAGCMTMTRRSASLQWPSERRRLMQATRMIRAPGMTWRLSFARDLSLTGQHPSKTCNVSWQHCGAC